MATEIRKTVEEDLDDVMRIYDAARVRMAEGGNPGQWVGGYPSAQTIRGDIARVATLRILFRNRS